MNIEVCFKLDADLEGMGPIDILNLINSGIEESFKNLSYIRPKGFVCEISVRNYSVLKSRHVGHGFSALYPDLLAFVTINNFAASMGIKFRFVYEVSK